MPEVTKAEVQELIEHAVVKLRDEMKDYIAENCKGHRNSFHATCEGLRTLVQQHDISITKLTQLAESERSLVGTKVDALTETVKRLCRVIEGNGHTGFATRMTVAENELRTLNEAAGEGRRGWREVLIQALPVLLTWVGFLVFWLIYTMAQSGVTP